MQSTDTPVVGRDLVRNARQWRTWLLEAAETWSRAFYTFFRRPDNVTPEDWDPPIVRVELGRVPKLHYNRAHGATREQQLNWIEHGAFLEQQFPGCTVAWDRHPTLPTWPRPYLRVSHNWMGQPPYQGHDARAGDPGHRRHRRQLHDRLREAQRPGPLVLVAYELARSALGYRPNMIGIERLKEPDDERGSSCLPGSRVYGWHNEARFTGDHMLIPIIAVYNVADERWTVVR